MPSNQDFRQALRTSVPVMLGYVPLGIVFGFLFVQAGAPWWIACLSSIIIFSGAAQYMMIPMLVSGASLTTIVLAAFVIGFRHCFYGLPLLTRYPRGLRRWLMVFTLTDETFAQLTVLRELNHGQMFWLSMLNYGWWNLGTLIGAVLGAGLTVNLAGFDFVLTALFAMLMTEQWRSRKTAWPVLVAAAGYALARLVSPENVLAISIGISLAAGLVWDALVQSGSAQRRA